MFGAHQLSKIKFDNNGFIFVILTFMVKKNLILILKKAS